MPKIQFKMDIETARWIAYLKERIATECFFMPVAGVRFPNDDGSSRQTAIASCKPRDWLELEHEPNNKYHKRAVKVLTQSRQQIGYLERTWGDLICIGASSGGRYTAVVVLIDPWLNHNILGIHIAVFRLSPQFLEENPSDGLAAPRGLVALPIREPQAVNPPTPKELAERQQTVFQSWLSRTQCNADVTIYAKLRGVQHDNAAGNSRQELLLGLQPNTELDVGANDELTKVQIYTKEGEEVGYLDITVSRKVLEGVLDGKVWKAYAGPVCDVPSGKWKTLIIGLVRVPEITSTETLPLAAIEEIIGPVQAEPFVTEPLMRSVVHPVAVSNRLHGGVAYRVGSAIARVWIALERRTK